MPIVVVERPGHAAASFDAPEGGRLLDLCDAHRAPVAFSCRAGHCSTCRVDVVRGASLLLPPGRDELEQLASTHDDPAARRLACQVIVRAADGVLRLRPAPGP